MVYHESVLVDEALRWQRPRDGELYVDATVGGGGHAAAILGCGPDVRCIGVDCDEDAITETQRRLRAFGSRVRLIRANFVELPTLGIEGVAGVLFDLGVSGHQFEASERGFSFAREGPLDMRLDQRLDGTAADIVASASEQELNRLLREYGDEPRANRIAAEIVKSRRQTPIRTTRQLAELVERVVGRRRADKIAPATKTFMALRIAVNRELDNLKSGLAAASGLLKTGGRLVVVSFHSGEDRIVKNFFQTESRDCLCPPQVIRCQCGHRRSLRILTKKPVSPSPEEIRRNPRARSARLRAAEKL